MQRIVPTSDLVRGERSFEMVRMVFVGLAAVSRTDIVEKVRILSSCIEARAAPMSILMSTGSPMYSWESSAAMKRTRRFQFYVLISVTFEFGILSRSVAMKMAMLTVSIPLLVSRGIDPISAFDGVWKDL